MKFLSLLILLSSLNAIADNKDKNICNDLMNSEREVLTERHDEYTFTSGYTEFASGEGIATTRRTESINIENIKNPLLDSNKSNTNLWSMDKIKNGIAVRFENGSYAKMKLEEIDGMPYLLLEETWSIYEAGPLGGELGQGGFHSFIKVPIEFKKGNIQAWQVGADVEFSTTANGAKDASLQLLESIKKGHSDSSWSTSSQIGGMGQELESMGEQMEFMSELMREFGLEEGSEESAKLLGEALDLGNQVMNMLEASTLNYTPNLNIQGKGSFEKIVIEYLDSPKYKIQIRSYKQN